MGSHVRLNPGKIVLCIDDNEDLLECEKQFLESFGYTVLTAPKRVQSTGSGFRPFD